MRSILLALLGATAAWCQPAPYLISTAAGGSRIAFPAQATTAQELRLILPSAVRADAAGNIYVADAYYDRILRIAPGGAVTSYAGSETGFGGDGGSPSAARFNGVPALAVNAAGEVFVCDRRNARVRKISAAGSSISTVAEDGSLAVAGNPNGIALDTAGNVFFSDSFHHVVRKMDAVQRRRRGCHIRQTADTLNHRIRRVNAQGRIDTVAGTGVAGETGGGSGRNFPSSARQFDLALPNSIGFTQAGDLLVLDDARRQIYGVNLAADTIQLAAGTIPGQAEGDNGPAVQAALLQPGGVAVDPDGAVYVSDVVDNRIRRIALNGVITTSAETFSIPRKSPIFRGHGVGCTSTEESCWRDYCWSTAGDGVAESRITPRLDTFYRKWLDGLPLKPLPSGPTPLQITLVRRTNHHSISYPMNRLMALIAERPYTQ